MRPLATETLSPSTRRRPEVGSFYSVIGCFALTGSGRWPTSECCAFPSHRDGHYDVLRGLDYFQSTGNLIDERLQDAVEVVLRDG